MISYRLQRIPIYEALAQQDGVHLPTAESRSDHRKARVSGAMHAEWETFSSGTTAGEALERALANGRLEAWPVVDNGRLIGMIPHEALERAVEASKDLRLSEIHTFPHEEPIADEFPHVHPDHTLGLALERMGSARQNVLPVVSRANVRQLLGVIALEDVLNALGVARKPEGERK
jgi:CIC family chloride channel protein